MRVTSCARQGFIGLALDAKLIGFIALKALGHFLLFALLVALLGRVAANESLWLDCGPALNAGLIAAFEDELLTEVQALPEPLYTVACGAAIALY